ncbi:hypothetical protein F5882DRAFT_377149 [Hyaloscypha sp. PMI_1271]|nr:hypothetical protein F5882DRAFT_377149 [Hyaloscypha sp. PMI_1271]
MSIPKPSDTESSLGIPRCLHIEKSPTRDSQDSTYFFFRANSIIPTKENVEMRRQSSHDASKSFTYPDATESPASFLKLPTELQNLIWEETFSLTADLRRRYPQTHQPSGWYSILIPDTLRTIRLPRITNFRAEPPLSYLSLSDIAAEFSKNNFNPNCDVCIYRFTDLSWRPDFIPGRCLFNYIEIIVNVSPDRLTSTTSQGLRSVEFSIRNGWYEDEWSQKSRLR